MKVLVALIAVSVLLAFAILGSQQAALRSFFGIAVPYAALALFIGGFIFRVLWWAKSPVPFRIPTTCGQQKSHDWIEPSPYENPADTKGVLVRMALEVFLFRSLFRNTTTELHRGPRLIYASNSWLWLAGLAFHYSFLLVLIRHLRFFTEPVPGFVLTLQSVDGFMEIGLPALYVTGAVLLGAVTFLLARRLASPQLRYLSLANDYFPLFLIGTIAGTGLLLRHFVRTDVASVKDLTLSLLHFQPAVPDGATPLFFGHFFLVCVLFAYFPFSKLVHMGGVFMSPTRNLANNNRIIRHINPWAAKAKLHTYAAYEDEFRERMLQAGIPVEKETADEPDKKEKKGKAKAKPAEAKKSEAKPAEAKQSVPADPAKAQAKKEEE